MNPRNQPPWMPDWIFYGLSLAIFIPAMYLFAWIARPIAYKIADILGLWTIALWLGITFGLYGLHGYLNWRKGTMPYQLRRAERLRNERIGR